MNRELKRINLQLAELREELALVEAQRERQKKRIARRNAKNMEVSELSNIATDDDFRAGVEYVVSFKARLSFENAPERVKLQYVSEFVKSKAGDTKYDLLTRAFESWIVGHYKADSPPTVESRSHISIVVRGSETKLAGRRMGRMTMLYKTFTELPQVFKTTDGSCGIDYLLYESASSGRKSWTRPYLEKRLGLWFTTNDLLAFAVEERDVSVYALDMFNNGFVKHVPEKSQICLFFVCNDEHMYPITDPSIRQSIRVKGSYSFADVKTNYADYDDVSAVSADSVFGDEHNHVVVMGRSDLTEVAGAVMRETGVKIEHWNFYNHELTAFKHPVKDQIIEAGDGYMERKAICDAEYNRHRLIDFKFVNQGYGQIARAMFEQRYGKLPTSQYSPDLKSVFKKYGIAPYRMCVDKNVSNHKSVDIKKCYSNLLLTNDEPIAVFGAFDCVLPIVLKSIDDVVAGEYYIARTFYMGLDNIKVSRGFYPNRFVKYVLARQYIWKSDITHAILASGSIPAETFKVFVEWVYTAYPEHAKNLINSLIGCFGSLYSRKETAGVSTDFETVMATMNMYADKKVKLAEVDDLYIVRVISETMKSFGDVPVYRMVLAQSLVELDKLTRAVSVHKKTRIVGYNTDAVKFTGPYNKSAVLSKENAPMGGYHLEESKALAGYTMDELEVKDAYVFEPLVIRETVDTGIDITKSQLVSGQGGCGKTTLVVQNKVVGDVVLTYTNASCERLKKDGVEAQTCDSFMMNPATERAETARFAGVGRVWLDEYKTVPPSLMSALLDAKEQYGFVLICLGDHRQTKAPCDNWVEYHTNKRFMSALGGNVLTLSYKFKRYSKDLYDVLCSFEETGVMDMPVGTIDSYHNICWTNAKRHAINKKCLARWVVEHNAKVVRVLGRDVCVGLEMMAYYENDLVLEIYKTHRWVIASIGKKSIVLVRGGRTIELSHARFLAIFDYSFAYTMYKIQGIEISEPFNIWEANRMSHNELYTAITRGVKKEHVHIDALRPKYKHDKTSHIHFTVKAQKETMGRVYLIRFSDGTGYVGQTVQSVEERFEQHRLTPTNECVAMAMNSEATIELLDEFYFTDKRQLDKAEKAYITKYEGIMTLLNERLVTKPVVVRAVKDVKPKKEKYGIKENGSKKRYEIYVGRKTETFSYARSTPEIAMGLAIERQNELRAIH